jgi:drug/metabolite transporter (DMT)-like permease
MSSVNPRTGIIFGLAAAAIWGGMYVVSKVVLEVVPPFALLSMRLGLGITVLAVWVLARRAWPRLALGQWGQITAIGLLGYGISLGFQFTGTKLATAANGAVITAATPAFVYLFAWLLLGEKVSRMRLAALAVSTLGVLAVIDPAQARLDGEMWLGNLLLVGAAITWALYSVLVRKATQTIGALPFSLIAFMGGMLIAAPAAGIELQTQTIGTIDLPIAIGILYLGVVSTALAAYLWNKAFEVLDAGVAALTFFAQPLVGAVFGAWLLAERLTFMFIIGGALILLGLWLGSRDDRIPN